jgi:hypothetical protein
MPERNVHQDSRWTARILNFRRQFPPETPPRASRLFLVSVRQHVCPGWTKVASVLKTDRPSSQTGGAETGAFLNSSIFEAGEVMPATIWQR